MNLRGEYSCVCSLSSDLTVDVWCSVITQRLFASTAFYPHTHTCWILPCCLATNVKLSLGQNWKPAPDLSTSQIESQMLPCEVKRCNVLCVCVCCSRSMTLGLQTCCLRRKVPDEERLDVFRLFPAACQSLETYVIFYSIALLIE